MRGISHFSFGFLIGYAVFLLACAFHPSTRLRLYGPFLTFVLGLWAAVPYALEFLHLVTPTALLHPAWNVFCWYASLNAAHGIAMALNNFEFDLALMICAYVHLLWCYIRLVSRARGRRAE